MKLLLLAVAMTSLIAALKRRREKSSTFNLVWVLASMLASASLALSWSFACSDKGNFDDLVERRLSGRSESVANSFSPSLKAWKGPVVVLFAAEEAERWRSLRLAPFKAQLSGTVSIENIPQNPRSGRYKWKELAEVIARHPADTLFISFCGLPVCGQNEEDEFWAGAPEQRFLVVDDVDTEIHPAAFESRALLGWCIERNQRPFLITAENQQQIRQELPGCFLPPLGSDDDQLASRGD
ncbi:MAG: hypothetical protein RL095_691 [Verrucomicrobiota bacterium]|jgi:hypothetical protein